MADKNADFLKKLLATFRIEADEHLKAMSAGLLELRRVPEQERQTEIVERIFREAHSLKGAARSVNRTDIESVCQSLESVYAALKRKKLIPAPPLLDLLQQTGDALYGLLPREAAGGNAPIAALLRRLDEASKSAAPAGEPPLAPVPEAALPAAAPRGVRPAAPDWASDTLRVASAKLDAVMRQTEELLAPRLAAGQRVLDLREAGGAVASWKKEHARIRPAVRAAERLLTRLGGGSGAGKGKEQQLLAKLLEYLDAESLHLKNIEHRLARLKRFAEHDQRALGGMVDGLLHDVREMHMLPFSSLTDIFPRFVRELARDQDKPVELKIEGGGIEVDRRILEAMKDPLVHLLRNCIDHGIERPAERARKGKPPQGTISLAMAQIDSGKMEILVADDGAGVDAAQVMAAARKLGLVSAEAAEALGQAEALALVFQSGISTSPMITDVSGHGLGLAIVREKVERLGGTVALETQADAGTAFRIVLPLSIATFRGILVRLGEQVFVLPASGVERVVRLAEQDIRTVENRETVPLDGQPASLVDLGDVLEMPRRGGGRVAGGSLHAVVLGAGAARVAFWVDEVLGEQEVLVKALGRQLARVRNVTGASVLATGRVAVVLNLPDLMKSAARQAAPARAPAAEVPVDAQPRSVLVVEDSITSRSLLKNILESAGYRVATAVDGVDAYTMLKSSTFDLVVSDVEMPRMDGFEFTSKVRSEARLAELPIVLVTALESREHRERGIDVGANAYIVKSSFDQGNLLEVIGRLI